MEASALDSPNRSVPGEFGQLIASADDQLILRRIVAALGSAGLPLPARASAGEELAGSLPDGGEDAAIVVLVCDVADPARMAELRRLRKRVRSARIIVVSPATDTTGVRRALDAGADGVVFDDELEATLAPSIMAVAAGQATVPRRLRDGFQKPAFSHRERQVLTHVTAGLTNSEIADALYLSQSTVKSHLSSAFAKLGVRSRREAAALILDPEQGLADLVAAGAPGLDAP